MLTFFISTFIFLLILSTVIIVHEFGHFIIAKKIGVRVEKFSLGFGPQLFRKKKNHTQYCISAIPLGGYVKLAGDNLEECKGHKYEYFSQPPGRRFFIIFFGPVLNYLLGLLLFWVIFFVGYPTLTTKVGGLLDNFGAKQAGIQIGDKITSIDGKAVYYFEDLQKIVHSKKDVQKVSLSILREGQALEIEVSIMKKKINDQLGQERNVGLLGITPFVETVKYGFFESLGLGFKKTWELTAMTYKALWLMLTGRLSVRDSVTGLPGMYFITSIAVSLGIVEVLRLVAVLSVSLAIFNLLPLPILDGGHILLLGIEKIRGRTLSIKIERVITQVGMALILTLVVLVTYNDLVRFYPDKIEKIFKLFK